jgi:hypothetical protein
MKEPIAAGGVVLAVDRLHREMGAKRQTDESADRNAALPRGNEGWLERGSSQIDADAKDRERPLVVKG